MAAGTVKPASTEAPQPAPVTASTRAVRPAAGALARGRRVAAYGRIVLPVVGTLVVLAGQLAEDLDDSPPLQMMPPTLFLQRWLLIGFVAYLFGVWAIAERTVERSLRAVRPAVRVGDDRFRQHARRMETMPIASEVILLIASAAVSLFLFAVLRADLFIDDPVTHAPHPLPFTPVGVVILAGYTVVGWAFLRLLFGTARVATALGVLAREPLRVNVFDTTELVPFGNIALALALAPAGAIVILIIALGRPTGPLGWSVIIEATAATVIALILPLRGIHRQMSKAKQAAFTQLSGQVTELYTEVTSSSPREGEEWGRLGGATGTLLQLRKTVQEMTTWPFRGTLAFSRALLIASAPLIYATLSELIRIFWLAPLTK